jgi:hypothetical protein
MMFRVIDSIHCNKNTAEKRILTLINKCKNPKVIHSEVSGAFIVVLCEAKDRCEACKARSYFKSIEIEAEIQGIKG